MKKRMFMLMSAAVVLLVMPAAGAHKDTSSDAPRCDTWFRQGHFTDANGDGKPDNSQGSHEHETTSDINDLRPIADTEIHAASGHYVVRNDYGYVEVVGGQSYRGPDPSLKSFPGQGGYVQGEVDAGNGTPDVDFLVAFFGPNADAAPGTIVADPVKWVNGSYGKACVDAAGQHQEQQTRTP